jgi:hypothetical protein
LLSIKNFYDYAECKRYYQYRARKFLFPIHTPKHHPSEYRHGIACGLGIV